MLSVTPIYAALLTLIFLILSIRVIKTRFSQKVSVGDAGDTEVMKSMRVQANFVEYAPLGVILLLLAELQGAPALALHVLGATLFLGRLCHAIGFGSKPQIIILRQAGMLATFAMLATTALGLLGHALT